MSQKIRLLLLITEDWTFWEIRLGLARVALDAGYEVTIATRVTAHAERIRQEGFHLVPIMMLRESRNPVREFLTFLELVRVYRRICPQIVQHVAMKPVFYGSLAAWVTRIPSVINVFGGLGYAFTDRPHETSVLRSTLQRGLRWAIALSRSVVVVQNQDDQDVLIQESIVPSSQVRLIAGSGVDIQRFVPVASPAGDPIVMLVGRMLWDKGVGEFVDAVVCLKQRGVRARFVLVGRCDRGNPTAIAEEQLQRWTQDHGIEWWGHREDLPEVIGRATLVVLPSYREGLPKVLLEAAACGKAVIATDVPGCREVVRHQKTGLLVPVRDSVALADAIATLLSNHELRTVMGASGREFVVREHSQEKIGRKFLDLYQERLALAGVSSVSQTKKFA
ncbi:MAG: glycosyltransferase family 4 protein [Nitrospiraceae bacterium]